MKKVTKIIAAMLVLAVLFCSITALAGDEKPVYVVIGDSIAAGTGLTNPESSAYGAIIANTNGYEYVNHAVPGHTTQNLLKMLSKEEVRTDVARADIISISIGGNNFLLGGLLSLIIRAAVFKDYSKFDEIADGVYDDWCEIISEVKELNPDALIISQLLYNPRYDFLREAYQQGSDRLNAVFPRYLEEHPGSYIIADIKTEFEGKPELIASDSIHPNADGHMLIAKTIQKLLYEQGLADTAEPVAAPADPQVSQNRFELFLIGIKNLFLTVVNFFTK